jgi:hypothetical protein
MRITVELPDELLRRIKVHAAMTDQKLKVLMPTLLDAGLTVIERSARGAPRRSTGGREAKPRRVVAPRATSRRH